MISSVFLHLLYIPVSQNARSAIFSLIAQVLIALLTQTQTQNEVTVVNNRHCLSFPQKN